MPPTHYALILPVKNEAECLGAVLDELLERLPADRFTLAVGLNACTDSSADIARQRGVLVGATDQSGYGHGCMAAISAFSSAPSAYIFVAGDGANDPTDILRLADEYEQTEANFIIGQRTLRTRNWHPMGVKRALPNITLGLYTSLLTGRLWSDLGPLRLITHDLFQTMHQQELTWGWTIESQILAARLGAHIRAYPVNERPRIAGAQKVSGVHWQQSLRIALAIAAAGWRVRMRPLSSS
jgi:glycosyltransferase involved in cell wall biosynthesis